jgi:hypothetical protein
MSLFTQWMRIWARELLYQSFLTLALDGGEWVTLLLGCWERIPIPLHKEAGVYHPECACPFWRWQNFLDPPRIWTPYHSGHILVTTNYTGHIIHVILYKLRNCIFLCHNYTGLENFTQVVYDNCNSLSHNLKYLLLVKMFLTRCLLWAG